MKIIYSWHLLRCPLESLWRTFCKPQLLILNETTLDHMHRMCESEVEGSRSPYWKFPHSLTISERKQIRESFLIEFNWTFHLWCCCSLHEGFHQNYSASSAFHQLPQMNTHILPIENFQFHFSTFWMQERVH